MTYFTTRQNSDSTWSICPTDSFGLQYKINGSWNVVCARLMGMGFGRYCMGCVLRGARIKGGDTYPRIAWNDEKAAKQMAGELNARCARLLG